MRKRMLTTNTEQDTAVADFSKSLEGKMQYGIIKSEFWSMFKKVVEKEKKNDEKFHSMRVCVKGKLKKEEWANLKYETY